MEPEKKTHNVSESFLIAYYEHQYDRMGKLEQSSLSITSIVVTLSVLAFTFGFDSSKAISIPSNLILPIIIGIANIFSALYILRCNSWIRTAEKRAKCILEQYALELYTIDKATYATHSKHAVSRWKIQFYLHILILIAALVPVIQFVG